MMIAILVLTASPDRSNAASGDCCRKSTFRRRFGPDPYAYPIHTRGPGDVRGEPWFAAVGAADPVSPIATRAALTALGSMRTAILRVFMFYGKWLSAFGNSALCIVMPFRDRRGSMPIWSQHCRVRAGWFLLAGAGRSAALGGNSEQEQGSWGKGSSHQSGNGSRRRARVHCVSPYQTAPAGARSLLASRQCATDSPRPSASRTRERRSRTADASTSMICAVCGGESRPGTRRTSPLAP